jgi:hypothetical protein
MNHIRVRPLTWSMLAVMARYGGLRLEQHGPEFWISCRQLTWQDRLRAFGSPL